MRSTTDLPDGFVLGRAVDPGDSNPVHGGPQVVL